MLTVREYISKINRIDPSLKLDGYNPKIVKGMYNLIKSSLDGVGLSLDTPLDNQALEELSRLFRRLIECEEYPNIATLPSYNEALKVFVTNSKGISEHYEFYWGFELSGDDLRDTVVCATREYIEELVLEHLYNLLEAVNESIKGCME